MLCDWHVTMADNQHVENTVGACHRLPQLLAAAPACSLPSALAPALALLEPEGLHCGCEQEPSLVPQFLTVEALTSIWEFACSHASPGPP